MTDTKKLASTFFSSYVTDENSPECISRICNIKIRKIHIPINLCKNMTEMCLGLSIRDSKTIMRSSPITLTDISENYYKIDLDFSFVIMYSHYFRRKSNVLNVVLQRRRMYNKKVVSGHKTIACAKVDLSYVVQKENNEILKLSSKSKKCPHVIVFLSAINSLPAENSMYTITKKNLKDPLNHNVVNSSESLSDIDTNSKNLQSKKFKNKISQKSQRSLTRFLGNLEMTNELKESILCLVEENDNFGNQFEVDSIISESSLDDDEFSVTDTSHRPTIRRFFQDSPLSGSIQSSLNEIGNKDTNKFGLFEDPHDSRELKTTIDHNSSLTVESTFQSLSNDVMENAGQLEINDESYFENLRSSQTEDLICCMNDTKYNYFFFIVMMEKTYSDINKIKLLRQNLRQRFIIIRDQSGIKQMFTTVFSQIQIQINTLQIIPKLKIGILGFDDCLSLFLQEIVLFNIPKLTDIINNTQFLYIPIAAGKLSNYFFSINSIYSSFFNDDEWLTSCDNNSPDIIKMINRILLFIHGETVPYLLPISTICLKKSHILGTTDENSPQITIPFITEVVVGFNNTHKKTIHSSSSFSAPNFRKSYPGDSFKEILKPKKLGFLKSRPRSLIKSEVAQLSINYWVASCAPNSKDHDKPVKTEKNELKLSNKSDCQLATIFRNDLSMGIYSQDRSDYLQMKIIKSTICHDQLIKNKKSKDHTKIDHVNNINHLVCKTKEQSFEVEIDGIVWDGIKYFTVSPKWPASLKNIYFGFPLT